jgi:hypothetical protein
MGRHRNQTQQYTRSAADARQGPTRILNAEKYDSKLAHAGEEKRSEIAKDR